MKYHYQVLESGYNYCLIIYSKKTMNQYLKTVSLLPKNQENNLNGPGVVIELTEEKKIITHKLKLNSLASIDTGINVYIIENILNQSLSVEGIDIIKNIIKLNCWNRFKDLNTEQKMIVEMLVDKYIKHIEDEEKK